MALLGKLLKNRRAGQAGLAWNSANLAGADTLGLSSPDFRNEGTIPVVHASGPGGAALDSAKPRDVLAAAGGVLARGRLDSFYERV